MKKIKLLVPALSIASVGAVVAPMVTSCAAKPFLSTSNMNYIGTVHEAVEEAWNEDEATTEYYKDAKFAAQDVLTVLADYYAGVYAKFIDPEQTYTNVKFNFTASVNNLTLGESKEAMTAHSVKATGYIVSGSLSGEYTVAYDKEIDAEEKYTKIRVEEHNSWTIDFKNCFSTLGYGTNWILYAEGCKDASEDWEYRRNETTETTTTYTLRVDNSKKVVNDMDNQEDVFGAKFGDNDMSIFPAFGSTPTPYLPSNYLQFVDHR